MGVRRLTNDAFAEAFTAHARALWCVAAGVLGSRSIVDDVLQEGALVALRKLDQFDPDTCFFAWMARIVRFVALNHARRRQRAPRSGFDAAFFDAPEAPRPGPPALTGRGDLPPDQASFDDDVLRALQDLDEIARACLLLRTVAELPYREIARALDIPEGTAMSHVHRTRRVLREKLHTRRPASTGADRS